MVTVVNRRTAGRPPTGVVRVYIGRPSPLGNPFVIGRDGSREDVIDKFEQQPLGPAGKRVLQSLIAMHQRGTDIDLECWCAPNACHGDVIQKWIENGGQP